MTQVWMVTGASGGFGRAIARAVPERGDRVVVAVRDPAATADLEREFPGAAATVAMDVTDAAAVRDGVAAAVARWGRIDVLVNNAGRGLLGAVEELADDDLRGLLETNLIGVLAVTRAVLPHLRAQGSGHIVQMSSVGGVVANPGHAAYNTTKFALEGLSEAPAGEVAPFGIRVTIVEPGPFRTDFAGRSMAAVPALADYRGTPAAVLRDGMADQDGQQPGDPALAAAAILRWVDDPGSALRLPLGERAVTRIRAKLTAQLADLDRAEPTALATAFGGR